MKLVFIRYTYVNAYTYKHTVPHKRTHTLSHTHTQAVCAHMKGADKRWPCAVSSVSHWQQIYSSIFHFLLPSVFLFTLVCISIVTGHRLIWLGFGNSFSIAATLVRDDTSQALHHLGWLPHELTKNKNKNLAFEILLCFCDHKWGLPIEFGSPSHFLGKDDGYCLTLMGGLGWCE